jgi:prepilin-type N-terminal cleavage/methylation domain-containing protein
MKGRLQPYRSVRGFTLMELMTVIVVILILPVIVLQVTGTIKDKAERANCTSNLRNLYTGASSYLQDHQEWPQIRESPNSTEYAQKWLAALTKYGITERNWLCPSVQRQMKNSQPLTGTDFRADYFATPFNNKPSTPYRWSTQPWFVERGNVHGDGNLMIFASGQVKSLKETIRDMQGRRFEYEQ